MPAAAAFAIPGELEQKTGGYIYEHRLLMGLRKLGHAVDHIVLSAGFPTPDARAMVEAVEAMRKVPPDMPLIVDGLVFGAVDPAGLRQVQAPVIAMLHHPLGLETGLAPKLAETLLATEAENLQRADHVVCTSAHTARLLQDRFAVAPARITVAIPGFPPVPAPVAAKAEPPLILSVGLMAERKGHDVLLQALSTITDLPWQGVIVGKVHDAGVADGLKRLAADLGLSGRVRFAGLVSDGELASLYAQATLFALASRYEGYGMAFAEALRNGLPVVACHTGAVPDTVPSGAGLLGPVDDVAAFAANLRRLLVDPVLFHALSDGARSVGDSLPDLDSPARIMSGVIERLHAAA
ncbi:glycosyltransferase family 4 protein [Aureimonas frigidaquae]|uniref:Glycosyl transferase-like protein n=1 Tax=Aureimonas frigidaquae TaxID=424757 RepID=A0A0P0Z3Q6_9HYPH|nr:glycosyltransferase family 4 protein [Aureimonas frigidaquae]BAT28747.1 glycosyl transferase-like protein [Aureimonas frigidaquae]